MYKIVLLSGFLVGTFFLSGCSHQSVTETQSKDTVPVTQKQAKPVINQDTQSPELVTPDNSLANMSSIGYSNWKTYSIGTLQIDLPEYFNKEVVSNLEKFKIIQTTSVEIKNNPAYIASIGCEESDCQNDGGTDGFVNVFKYDGKTPLDALMEVCTKIKNDIPSTTCVPTKFITTSGFDAFELGLGENYFSVGSGSDSYVFSIGNSSGAVQGQKNNLWKTIIGTAKPATE